MKIELSYIQDEVIRKDGEYLVSLLPKYFWNVAASSTGKYHPKFSLGTGGLVRHTKCAVRIAKELLALEQYGFFNQKEKDMMILALILHDGLKHGYEDENGNYEQYTTDKHPILMHDFILMHSDELKMSKDDITIIGNLISKHMGQWIYNRNGEQILEAPKSSMEKFVHECDYLASRKFLNVDFYEDEII